MPYLDSLQKEIECYYAGEEIETLYIGGGTPSSLDMEELEKLFSILKKFKLSQNIEFTIECNIEHLTEEKLKFFFQNGVNRLSIGIQTVEEKFLPFLERNHTKEEVFQKINLAKNIGFQNINVDLMYAFPNQTIEDISEDIHTFLQLDVPHISTYSLMIEPHTKIYGKVKPIDEEKDEQMFQMIDKELTKRGYIHYETSNYCKKGYESKHNLNYWNNENYYGFGLSASGYVNNIRYENTKNLHHYDNGHYRKEEQVLTKDEILENEFILGFRKMEGISKKNFEKKYHQRITDLIIIKKLLKKGYLKENEEYVYIPKEYIYVSNEILLNFIDMEVYYG